MLNYWWVTRPKRKLDTIPDVLKNFVGLSLNQEWSGNRESHLAYEEALESAGLKRTGKRTDQTGGGARTYKAWLMSLGLIYTDTKNGSIKLTEAGWSLIHGENPKKVLSTQVLNYQFPSAFSVSRGVQVASRFHLFPFRFLLKLLLDERVNYLTEEEIAKIIATEAEENTPECYEYVVSRINTFRSEGDDCLPKDFYLRYQSSKGGINLKHPYSHLMDLANTLVHWLEYTELISRTDGKIYVPNGRREQVYKIINEKRQLIDHPENQEVFQEKYGSIDDSN